MTETLSFKEKLGEILFPGLRERPTIIQTKFGAAKVERIADGFFVAAIGAASGVGRTAPEAAKAASRIAQNLMLIERENY